MELVEIWIKIPGYSRYQISNFGAVKNCDGKIIKQFLNGTRDNNKYYAVFLSSDVPTVGWQSRRKIMKIHRLMLMTFVGFPDDGQIGCHRNGIRTDNRLENLYWGTHSDNAKDAINHGTFHFVSPGIGENHVNAKLTDEQIKAIRLQYSGKRGEQTILANKYGVSQQWISDIVRNEVRSVH